MTKILFLAAHRPGRSPGQRFRFEQYLAALEAKGCTCEISWLLSEKDDRYFYRKGFYLHKLLILIKTISIRLKDLRRAGDFDVIFMYREMVMFGSVWFEKRFRKKAKRLMLDYDDAIWLKDVSPGNRELSWLKRPSKTADIITLCDLVIAGNSYLADFARQYHQNVIVVPTTIDTSLCKNIPQQTEKKTICIGWTGSATTLGHLEYAVPILKKLQQTYGDRIKLRVIADRPWTHPGLTVEFVPWNRETEMQDLLHIDIGIMPLPDDDWARGKCGFKGLQYMALGIPAVLSRVGVNTEIIQDGVNGFLAGDENEWFEKISALADDPELRQTLGRRGKQTVEEKYSFSAWKDTYVKLFCPQ